MIFQGLYILHVSFFGESKTATKKGVFGQFILNLTNSRSLFFLRILHHKPLALDIETPGCELFGIWTPKTYHTSRGSVFELQKHTIKHLLRRFFVPQQHTINKEVWLDVYRETSPKTKKETRTPLRHGSRRNVSRSRLLVKDFWDWSRQKDVS